MNHSIENYTKEEFDKLHPTDKRVLIAHDVLARIDRGIITPVTGEYYSLSSKDRRNNCQELKEDLKGHVNNNRCQACAIGSIVCSWIGNFNTVKIQGIYHNIEIELVDIFSVYQNEQTQELLKIFPERMLHIIEQLFECWARPYLLLHIDGITIKLDTKKFYSKHNTPVSILVAIMTHIVNNDGDFELSELLNPEN